MLNDSLDNVLPLAQQAGQADKRCQRMRKDANCSMWREICSFCVLLSAHFLTEAD